MATAIIKTRMYDEGGNRNSYDRNSCDGKDCDHDFYDHRNYDSRVCSGMAGNSCTQSGTNRPN